MALEKITEAQMNANGVVAAPDILNGTAAENKAIFDRMVRNLVAPAYNACVDAVNGLTEMETGARANEEARQAAEEERNTAEEERCIAEAARREAEAERQTAEEVRQDLETGYVAQAQTAAEAAEYWAGRAQQAAGGGDMQTDVYDPQGMAQDVFAYADNKVQELSDSIDERLEDAGGASVYEATIGTVWTEDENTGAKSQTVAISGVTAASTAKVDHSSASVDGTSAGYATFVEEENQYLTYITNGFAETVDGGIKFTIFGDPNTVAIPIVVEVV